MQAFRRAANSGFVGFFRAAGRLFGMLSMLILEFPNEKHRAAYEEMVQGWRSVETPTSPGKLFTGKNFDEFLSIVQREPTESDPEKVPAHLFFFADTQARDFSVPSKFATTLTTRTSSRLVVTSATASAQARGARGTRRRCWLSLFPNRKKSGFLTSSSLVRTRTLDLGK